MKVIVTLIVSLLACLNLCAQSLTEYFNVGNPIEFCGIRYYLAWSACPQENYFIQEYLPQGESFEHYNQMFTVSVLFWNISPLEAVQAKVAELEQRKQSDPVMNYMVSENNGDYILDFIVSAGENGYVNTAEFDIHLYRQMTINGRKAMVLYFYSSRAYGDDILPFIQSIPKNRKALYEGINELKLIPVFPKK